DPHRVLEWILERRVILDRRGIEYHDVRRRAGREPSAVRDPETRRWHPAHLVNRLRERQRLALAHVLPEHTWERTEASRMRVPAFGRPVGCERAAVGAHHALRMRQDPLEILFAHRESDHADTAFAAL